MTSTEVAQSYPETSDLWFFVPRYTRALLWQARGQHCSHHISTNLPLRPLHGWGPLWEEPLVRLSSTGHPLPEPGHGHTKPWCSASEIIRPRSRSKRGHRQLSHQEQVSCRQFWLNTAGNGISFNSYQVSKTAQIIPLFCGRAKDTAVPEAHCSWRGSSSSPPLCTAGQSQICTAAQKKGVLVMGVWLQSYGWGIRRKAGIHNKAWVLHSNVKSNEFWASSSEFKWNPNQRQSEYKVSSAARHQSRLLFSLQAAGFVIGARADVCKHTAVAAFHNYYTFLPWTCIPLPLKGGSSQRPNRLQPFLRTLLKPSDCATFLDLGLFGGLVLLGTVADFVLKCSREPIKIALGAHKEQACASRESLDCVHCGSLSCSAERKQAERRKPIHRAVRDTRQVPCWHKFMELGAFQRREHSVGLLLQNKH